MQRNRWPSSSLVIVLYMAESVISKSDSRALPHCSVESNHGLVGLYLFRAIEEIIIPVLVTSVVETERWGADPRS